MRFILIALVLINAAFLGWGLYEKSREPDRPANEAALPPLEGSKLILLSETRPKVGSAKPPPSLSSASPSTGEMAAQPAMCVSIGPLKTEESANKVSVALLEQINVQSRVQVIELTRDVQYWVLLPPFETRRESLGSLRQLQSKKIDSYLIETGELKNAISLGLFSKESSAKGILDKIKLEGFAPEIRQKVRVTNEYWVRIPPGQAIEKLQETLQSLMKKDSGIKISKASCEMFALSK